MVDLKILDRLLPPELEGIDLAARVASRWTSVPGPPWTAPRTGLPYETRRLDLATLADAMDRAEARAVVRVREIFAHYREFVACSAEDRDPEAIDALFRLARRLGERGEREVARQLARVVLARVEHEGDGGRRAEALGRLGRWNVEDARLRRAQVRFAALREIGRSRGEDGILVAALIGLGDVAADRGRLLTGRRFYRRARQVAERGGDEWSSLEATIRLGAVERARGELDRALEMSDRALARLPRADSPDLLATVLLDRGRTQVARGDHGAAASCYRRALAIRPGPEIAGPTHLHLSRCLLAAGKRLPAESEARRAETIAVQEGYLRLLAQVYRQLGGITGIRREIGAAAFYEKAHEIALRCDDRRGVVEILFDYGRFLQLMGDSAAARACYDRALDELARHGLAGRSIRVEAEIPGTRSVH